VKRLLFLLVLAVGLMVASCDAPDSNGERAGKERGPVKAAQDERPGSESGAKNEAKRFERKSQSSTSPAETQYSTADATYSTGPSPEEVLASQYQHINAGNYGAAYGLFDDQSQQRISQEQYEAYFASAAPYEVTRYSFSSVRSQGDTASVVVDLAVSSASDEDAYRVTQQLVREDGRWRVVMREDQVASFADAGSASANASASASGAYEGASGDHETTVTVSRVVDGDTIEVSPAVSGNDEVRLIGIDTPETKDPTEGVEPLGPEASAFATDELSGRSVDLEFDVEREDQYGRLLAYVYVGGEMFNEVLLEEGYAQTYPYPPNTKYEDRFVEAQEEARADGLGIWSLSLEQQCQLANHGNGIGEGSAGCEVVPDPGATATATATATVTATAEPSGGGVPPISEEHCPPNAPIKGNDSSSGELIYHTRSSATYDETHPEECFATEAASQAAGYRAARD
jgi:micrococcal nuclease